MIIDNEPYIGRLWAFSIKKSCLHKNYLLITVNCFFMYPSWCCFSHELHCSFFQIQCFQGNWESYSMGKDSSISVRLITCKVHAEDVAVVQIVRWVDFYNKPHYSYFEQHGPAMNMVLVHSVFGWKTCEGSGQFLRYWPLWMRQRGIRRVWPFCQLPFST